MAISKEELLHIANLAELNLNDNEIDNYLKNLEEIVEFANVVNDAPVDNLDITIGANSLQNRFRKDEVEIFEDNDSLLANCAEIDQHMFKLPKVIQ